MSDQKNASVMTPSQRAGQWLLKRRNAFAEYAQRLFPHDDAPRVIRLFRDVGQQLKYRWRQRFLIVAWYYRHRLVQFALLRSVVEASLSLDKQRLLKPVGRRLRHIQQRVDHRRSQT